MKELINKYLLATILFFLLIPLTNAQQDDQSKILMRHVINADYNEIEKAWNKNLELMFLPVIRADGITDISPLQKSFELYDTYTWKGFYEKIKDQPELVDRFFEQADQQKNHINLQPLFDAYEAYRVQYYKWLDSEITDRDLENEWINLGKLQRELLPLHMLREFCREGDTWSSQSRFDTKLPPPNGGSIYNYSTSKTIDLDSSDFHSGFGSSFSIVRGVASTYAAGGQRDGWEGPWGHPWLFDPMIFSRLFEIRIADLVTHLSLRDQQLQHFTAPKN